MTSHPCTPGLTRTGSIQQATLRLSRSQTPQTSTSTLASPPLTPKRKTHFPPVCHLSGRRNDKTHARTKPYLYANRSAAPDYRYVVHPRIRKSREKGYILKIHEVWHFPKTEVELFSNQVNTWLKIKEEANGWPPHVGYDPTMQRQHLADYETHERIKLDPTTIQKNPGLRTLAKMMLNSMWGKFGQQTQVKEEKLKQTRILYFTCTKLKTTK